MKINEYLKYLIKESKNNLQDLKSTKTFYKQIPNLLTFSRMVAPIPINILFFSGNITGALIVSLIAFITDAFDGKYARKHNLQSKFGADLDAICDKALITGISIPIVILNPLMILNILLECGIAITNAKAKFEGKEPKSSITGKLKTWFLSIEVILGYIAAFFNIPVSLLTSILVLTPTIIIQALTLNGYIRTNNKENKKTLPNELNNNEIELVQEKNKDDKKLDKEYDRPMTIKELKKLKEELLITNNTDDISYNHQKTKSRF